MRPFLLLILAIATVLGDKVLIDTPNNVNILSPESVAYSVSVANRMCEFELVSYCIGQGGHGVPQWDCAPCKQYFPKLVNVTVVKTWYLDYDTHAFVVYDPYYYNNGQARIVMAFAGTDPLSLTNWIDDLDAFQELYPLSQPLNECTDCYVHKGFYDTYASVATDMWNAVASYRSQFGSTLPVQITGHSLGAALAAHAALDGVLTHNIQPELVYTYGQPRVGDKAWASYYATKISGHIRITHHKDPVPHLPDEWMGRTGYYHMITEVFYASDPNGTYSICSGGEDPNCSDQYLADLDILDHLDYMGFDFTTNMIDCKV